jgi:glucose-6-phosphate 1-dehydrogenase
VATSQTTDLRADVLVIFGITGDLGRKMTFGALYNLEAAGRLDCPIIGVAREDWSHDRLAEAMREDLEAGGIAVRDEVLRRLAGRFTFLSGDFADPATYAGLGELLKDAARPLFYLEIPPSLFAGVVDALGRAGLAERAAVIIEKPFGHDLDSARALNQALHETLAEDQILRIDHFLGKQPVLDISVLRFANVMLEPVWNRDHVSAVQITMAEDFGVQDRGAFYDAVGALRDVVQNHLLQVLALLAMEVPDGPGSQALWDRKTEVFRAMADADPRRCVRGQYAHYRDVPGVKADSVTETYIALRLQVDNQRWAGVPFFIRAGKELPVQATEVRVVFKRPPALELLDVAHRPPPNQLVFRIDPDPGLRLVLLSKGPAGNNLTDVHMDLPFVEEIGRPPAPYERLLHDALIGEHSLFTREDAVEETWRVLQPLLDDPPTPATYPRGSWGPPQAADLLRGHPPWQPPWLPADPGAGQPARRGTEGP